MKVKDFILELQKLPQNLEIVFYNGFVDDVQPISKNFIVQELKKYNLKYYQDVLTYEYYRKNKIDLNQELSQTQITEINKKAKEIYSKNNKYEPRDSDMNCVDIDFSNWYQKKTKKRILLQANRAGKVYSDRLGKIEY